jgi:hypothetical protein
MASIHRRTVRWTTHTAQRRAGALDKEAEAARAVAHRIEKEALATKTIAAGALRRLKALSLPHARPTKPPVAPA